MGKFQAMIKYVAVIVALFVCNYSLPIHGRHLKPFKNQQHSSLNTGSVVKPQPSLSPLNVAVAMKPNHKVASFGDSGADTNAFRPTTPGGSPGVGHRYVNNVKVQSPSHDVEISVTTEGSKNDFKPTDPGHSPGVGHSYPHKIGHLN
ncbi:hypothetical protein SESBI_33251 [Sesbania bispinosa]|nr:hypothetical protein SESBI_33251 [Sesbania bispinosa]